MAIELQPVGIIRSFSMLKGNTRISIIFEPLWGIPYSLFSFYLSLYMKSQGITDEQIGFLISAGFVASIIFSIFGGMITNTLGRRKTTLIFDLLSWPLALFLYLISRSFWMFALAQIVNSLVKISAVSWNLMVVEDADAHQQIAAYNLINLINILVGIFTPLAGIMIRELGIESGERILLGFAVLSMSIMVFGRNHYYQETRVGQEILNDHKEPGDKKSLKPNLTLFLFLKKKPVVVMVLCLSILFYAYIPIGTYLSLYYAPFLTEILKLDKSAIAILGGVNAAVMVMIFVFLTPLFSRWNRYCLMAAGAFIQILSLVLFITIPPHNFGLAIVSVVLFALGFGIAKPFIDSILAEVTEGKERAAIYAIYNTAVSVLSAGLGFASGYLYELNPALIYMISMGILVLCMGPLFWLNTAKRRAQSADNVL